MRLLILGATGVIGTQLADLCRIRDYEWLGTTSDGGRSDLSQIDTRDSEAVTAAVRDFRPDVIFHAATIDDPMRAQARPAEAFAVNLDGTIHVALAARRYEVPLVFFSSADVFAPADRVAREDDLPDAMTVLGKSLEAAEDCVRPLVPNAHLIIRGSCVFGPGADCSDFVASVVTDLRAGRRVRASRVRRLQPTFASDLAEVALRLAFKKRRGTFHVAGPDRLSELDCARLIVHAFRFDARLVEANAATEPGPRELDCCKLLDSLGATAVRGAAVALRSMAREATPRAA